LAAGQNRVSELWIAKGKKSTRINEVLYIADGKKIPVITKSNHELDKIFPDIAHQGIIAVTEEFSYTDIGDLTEISLNAPGYALLIAADHITDEGNLGAIIRTATFFGADGLIIPKDRSAQVTGNVQKRSSGAYFHLPVARVINLGRTLDTLSKKGFWVIGSDGKSLESIYRFDWNRDLVLVMGSEDKGIGRSVRSRCHQLVGIPSSGKTESLNVSVACGSILSEIIRQKRSKMEA
jgi:23S rRNA (guanosine2251-2'-O)-methyltransferase